MKRHTPLKAIRQKCLDCSGFSVKEVRECPAIDCSFYPLRMGKGSRATLKKIKAHCLWCCNNQNKEIKLCPAVQCPLWEYRFGRRPQKSPVTSKIATTEGVFAANSGCI